MPNEFIIREGFSSRGNVVVTGSLTVTSITGSLTTASYAITASFSNNSNTASFIQVIPTASYAATGLSASISVETNKTIYNPAASYAQVGVSSSLWNTTFGNNGYITPVFFQTNGNVGQAVASLRSFYTNSIFLTPIYINKTGVLARFGIFGTLLGSPTGSWRVGVYSNSTNMLPQNKVFEFDTNIFPTANFRVLYEVTTSAGPTLQQGQIYWLATSTEHNFSNISYTYVQHTEGAYMSQNRVINPLLGSAIPITENAIRNIAYYRYAIPSTGSAMPLTLSQSISFYTTVDYGANQGNNSSIHMGPFIKLNY